MKTYCIIMAGGVGSRFWPESRESMPKQFLDILGTGETLIQQTYNRFKPFCEDSDFIIVTNESYIDIILEQLPNIKRSQILAEPMMRNTAPCIAYAAYKIASINPEANLIVTPADHIVLNQKEFERVVNLALDHTAVNNQLLTFGIPPTRPDTGYGYIEYDSTASEIKKVIQFKEKPDMASAIKYVAKGSFSWNSGMFFWSLATILDAFEDHLPDIARTFKKGMEFYNTDKEAEFINEVYPNCESISIDYGIMEKADNVFVINASIGWSDLGTWGSVYTRLNLDSNSNACDNEKVVLKNVSNSLIKLPENKVAIVEGLEGYIVVDTEDALLIVRKSKEQEIKKLREQVGKEFGKEYI